MHFKLKNILYHAACGLIITFFLLFLIKNQNHFPVPNTDIFQYIGDGYQYINFKLPESIHPPPFAPILICLIANILRGFVEYPELVSVHFIVFFCATFTLLNVFLIIKKYSPLIALATILLLATNQIYINNSLNVTNEIIYGYFLTLVIFLYQKKPALAVYLLSGLLFLIRYESIVLPVSIFIIELISRKKQFRLKNAIFAFVPIILWSIVLHHHSAGSSILENAYIKEIFYGLQNIPNLKAFHSLFSIFLFNSHKLFLIPSIIIVILFAYEIIRPKTPSILKIIYLIFILHNLFLALFPNFYPRYQLPIIWILYFFIINRRSNTLKIIIVLALLIYNFSQIKKPYALDRSSENIEYRLTANWFNKQNFQHPIQLYIYDPGIIRYFVYNPKVFLNFTSYEGTPDLFSKCHDQLSCVLKKRYLNIFPSSLLCDNLTSNKMSQTPQEIYIVTTSNSSIPLNEISDQYTALSHHMTAFQKIYFLNQHHHFQLVTLLGNTSNWAKIYKYNP